MHNHSWWVASHPSTPWISPCTAYICYECEKVLSVSTMEETLATTYQVRSAK